MGQFLLKGGTGAMKGMFRGRWDEIHTSPHTS
jgi:hypothetical protein